MTQDAFPSGSISRTTTTEKTTVVVEQTFNISEIFLSHDSLTQILKQAYIQKFGPIPENSVFGVWPEIDWRDEEYIGMNVTVKTPT